MKERKAQNSGAGLYTDWMKALNRKPHTALDQMNEPMNKYYY